MNIEISQKDIDAISQLSKSIELMIKGGSAGGGLIKDVEIVNNFVDWFNHKTSTSRFFYIVYGTALTKGEVWMEVENGRYVNKKIIKDALVRAGHFSPVILEIIEMTESDYNDFLKE